MDASRRFHPGTDPFAGVLVIHRLPGWDSGDQGDHPSLRRQGLQRDMPEPLRPPGPRCRARRCRRGHPRGGRHPRRRIRRATPTRPSRRCGALPTANGKVGVIGYCSGGRHSFLTAVSLSGRCGGRLLRGLRDRHRSRAGFPLKVTPLVDRTPGSALPLLGLFGNDDQFPDLSRWTSWSWR